MSPTTPHHPVLLKEMLEALAPRDGGIYIDGTFGAGGYTRAILANARCRVFAIDRDPNAAHFAEALQKEVGDRLTFIVGNFADMCELVGAYGVEKVDGIVLDIGVSSMQFDEAGRGFSFRHDAPLDMRMSGAGMSAADVIANTGEEELANIIYRYGEEKASRRIAKAIVAARSEKPITRTIELAEIVRSVVGKHSATDPATKTFQALRIHVNDELGQLQAALDASKTLLAPGGRLVVVTFHSLEDRMVKQFTHSLCGTKGVSRHSPVVEVAASPVFSLPKPHKHKPGKVELQANPRARSATLRVAIRTEAVI